MSHLALLALVACTHKHPDTGDSAPGTEDTGTAFNGPSYTGFLKTGPDESLDGITPVVSLVSVSLTDATTPGPALDYHAITGTGVFTINLPDEPPAEQIVDLGGAYAGVKAGIWMPLFFDDSNGNNAFDQDKETALGLNQDLWLGYVDPSGTVPDGWPTGWTLLNPNLTTGEAPTFVPIGQEGQITFIGGEAEAWVTGFWNTIPSDGNAYSVVAIDEHYWSTGTYVQAYPVDTPINTDGGLDEFSEAVAYRPDADTFYKDDPDLWYAAFRLMVYVDADVDGQFDNADTLTGYGTCVGEEPIYLRYVNPPANIQELLELDRAGWTAGWHALTASDGVEHDHNYTQSLTIDPDTCLVPLP